MGAPAPPGAGGAAVGAPPLHTPAEVAAAAGAFTARFATLPTHDQLFAGRGTHASVVRSTLKPPGPTATCRKLHTVVVRLEQLDAGCRAASGSYASGYGISREDFATMGVAPMDRGIPAHSLEAQAEMQRFFVAALKCCAITGQRIDAAGLVAGGGAVAAVVPVVPQTPSSPVHHLLAMMLHGRTLAGGGGKLPELEALEALRVQWARGGTGAGAGAGGGAGGGARALPLPDSLLVLVARTLLE